MRAAPADARAPPAANHADRDSPRPRCARRRAAPRARRRRRRALRAAPPFRNRSSATAAAAPDRSAGIFPAFVAPTDRTRARRATRRWSRRSAPRARRAVRARARRRRRAASADELRAGHRALRRDGWAHPRARARADAMRAYDPDDRPRGAPIARGGDPSAPRDLRDVPRSVRAHRPLPRRAGGVARAPPIARQLPRRDRDRARARARAFAGVALGAPVARAAVVVRARRRADRARRPLPPDRRSRPRAARR